MLPVNANASPTIHQGIESALSAALWKAGNGDRVVLRQSFTFNDFYFKGDPLYGKNELPSLPRVAYQADLFYQQTKGFYASVGVRHASAYYVDFKNTVKGDAFTILNAKVGYENDRWQVFLDLRNLTDKNYATAANTAFDLGGNRATAFNFYPGDTFNFILGVGYDF